MMMMINLAVKLCNILSFCVFRFAAGLRQALSCTDFAQSHRMSVCRYNFLIFLFIDNVIPYYRCFQ